VGNRATWLGRDNQGHSYRRDPYAQNGLRLFKTVTPPACHWEGILLSRVEKKRAGSWYRGMDEVRSSSRNAGKTWSTGNVETRSIFGGMTAASIFRSEGRGATSRSRQGRTSWFVKDRTGRGNAERYNLAKILSGALGLMGSEGRTSNALPGWLRLTGCLTTQERIHLDKGAGKPGRKGGLSTRSLNDMFLKIPGTQVSLQEC